MTAQETLPRKTIRKISIQGLRREPEGDLLSRLRIRIGEVYDSRRVSEETGLLYGTGKFRRVEWQFAESEEGVAITFEVEERPVVKAVEFRGRDALSESHLRTSPPALETKTKALLNEARLQQDRESILEKYHDAGYIFAQVETKVEEGPEGARVVFEIQEGTRVRIREVKFVGNKSVPAGILRGIINTRKRDFWFFGLITPGFYDYDLLEQDLNTVERYYWRLGYFDVKAEIQEVSLDLAKEKMTIVIRVREGSQYTFRGYRFEKNRVFSEQTLLDLTTAVPGQPFNADTLQRDRQEIFNYYGDRAYIDAQVEYRLQNEIEGHDVHIVFEIEEKNEVYIEEVKLRGNVKTLDRVIRRELEFYPGERVDRSKLEKSRSNLNRLQIFKNVGYGFEDGTAPGNKNVLLTVEEEASGRLILGFGVNSGGGIIGNFSIIKRNFDVTDLPESLYDIPDSFTGAGQTLTLVAQPGTKRSLYRFSITEPYLFGTRNELTLSAARLTLLRKDYDENRSTFAPSISHAFDFDRDLRFTLGHRLEEVEINDVDKGAPADAFAAEGFSTVIAASAGMSYNKVLYEYLEGPYDGTNSVVFYEYAGGVLGGDVDFHKGEATNEFYYPVYTFTRGPERMHHVVSLLNRFGVIEPQDSNDSIPIFERFFLGGPNSVRGFKFRELGPHDRGDPTGGTGMLYGNLEYTFPLFLKILRGVVFFDYGNLATDISSFTIDEMRYTVGGGLKINFPLFGQPLPIGLYLGQAIKKEPDDKTRLFLFTIGVPF